MILFTKLSKNLILKYITKTKKYKKGSKDPNIILNDDINIIINLKFCDLIIKSNHLGLLLLILEKLIINLK